MGRETAALVTNMDVPLGRAVGNSLEVIEAAETLNGSGEKDLFAISLELAANMLFLSLGKPLDECREMALDAVNSGRALDKLCTMVAAQGGNAEFIKNPALFPAANVKALFTAKESGWILHMDTERIGMAALAAGAGRKTLDDSIDPSAGIMIRFKTGSRINTGDVIAEIYASDEKRAEAAMNEFTLALEFTNEKPADEKLIYALVNSNGTVLF